MIHINLPQIVKTDTSAKLSSLIEFEDHDEILWFEVPIEVQKYLVVENIDAFLVGILFLALKLGEDIQLKAPVSAKLYYNLNHYVIPALCLANPKLKRIKIFNDKVNDENLNLVKVAGTGLSCGIDSFSTYYDHINEKNAYKIEYFAFFNVGSHGTESQIATRLFKERYEKAKAFAKSINKDIIKIDSNLSLILNMKFQSTNTLRNASCVLILQKLFRNYYIASKNRFDYFKLHDYDTQDYDSLILNLLSTESTTFHSSVAQFTRVQRTALISIHPETYNYLDICTSSKKYNDGVNCSQCNKCLRTALTLDLLGKLNLYKNVFHIDKYEQLKNNYIAHVIKTKYKDQINGHLYDLLKEKVAINYKKIIISKVKTKFFGRMK